MRARCWRKARSTMSAPIHASSKSIWGAKSMLEVANVSLRYGAAIALKSASVTAEAGRVTCLLGRNGVGKTSLLRAVVGHHPIFAGSIRWQGEDVTRLAPYERARRGIAYVPQGREIFPLLTVR